MMEFDNSIHFEQGPDYSFGEPDAPNNNWKMSLEM